MSSTINASTASGGGVITTADASGILQLQTASTTALTIDASQNVGIGTSSPAYKLHISGTVVGGSFFSPIVTNTDTTTGSRAAMVASHGSISTVLGARADTGYGEVGTFTNHPMVFLTNTTERMRIDSSGNLLVGTTSAIAGKVAILTTGNASASMAQTGTTGDHIYFRTSTTTLAGYISSPTGTTVSYVSISDQRLKENIVDAPSALVSVNAIKVRSFDWKTDGTHVDYGYIAQELLEVAPEAVSVPEDSEQMMGVDFGKLTPRLVKAIQELKAIIDTQTARIEALEAKI